METNHSYVFNNRYWWLMIIIGILSILCGIWVFQNPIESYFAMAIYFSLIFILYGINEIIQAFSNRQTPYWGWGLVTGVIDLIIGFILLGNLLWTIDVLPYLVGIVLMFTGINYIGQASIMSSERHKSWGWVLTGGIFTLIFAFLIIFHPLFGALDLIFWTGLAFIFGGISAIVYAFALK